MQVGSFKASSAYVLTNKDKFSYAYNDNDRKTQLLFIAYRRGESKVQGVYRFNFMEIKNNGIYEEIKKNGNVAFERYNGEKIVVKVSLSQVIGKEVLKTEIYKMAGELSNPKGADFISYFWKENDTCYKYPLRETDRRRKASSLL